MMRRASSFLARRALGTEHHGAEARPAHLEPGSTQVHVVHVVRSLCVVRSDGRGFAVTAEDPFEGRRDLAECAVGLDRVDEHGHEVHTGIRGLGGDPAQRGGDASARRRSFTVARRFSCSSSTSGPMYSVFGVPSSPSVAALTPTTIRVPDETPDSKR